MPTPRGAFRPMRDLTRSEMVACVAFALVVGGSYACFVAIAHFEPVIGDGFNVSLAMKERPGLSGLLRHMHQYHERGNPRLGQFFTFATYRSELFHALFTPLVACLWAVLAVFHATGRRLDPRSSRDVGLVLLAFAALWLVLPEPAHVLFYRPITTNYFYSVVFVLAYFVPMRLDFRVQRASTTLLVALLMLLGGWLVGQLNEHAGPALVLTAAFSAAVALRERRLLDALWRGVAACGLLLGFLRLFFAPGQTRRYRGLGRQSVLDTILDRGVTGTAALIGDIVLQLAPLLALIAVLFATYFVSGAKSRMREAGPHGPMPEPAPPAQGWWPEARWLLVYVAVAAVMFGTSFAAPRNIYRLFTEPSLLVAVAGIGVVDRIWRARPVQLLACGCALVVHAGFLAFALAIFADVHAGELKRIALARAAPPRGVLVLPPLPHAAGNHVFFGDTLIDNRRNQAAMAKTYGLERVEMPRGTRIKRYEVRADRSHKMKAHKKKKARKRSGS